MKFSTIIKIYLLAMSLILFPVNEIFAQDMFYTRVDYAVGQRPRSVFSIDFNSDGNNDLATANFSSDNVSILLGNGGGKFQSAARRVL